MLKLTHGLYAVDASQEELDFLEFHKNYINFKDDIYKINSKYRLGTINSIGKEMAYVHLYQDNTRDLQIPLFDLNEAVVGDIVLVKRLLNARGPAKAKVEIVLGSEQSYSIVYLKKVDGNLTYSDFKTSHPVSIEIDNSFSSNENDIFKLDNQSFKIVEFLGNIEDPHVDEKILLAIYNRHTTFDQDVLDIATSFKQEDVNTKDRVDLRDLDFVTIDPVTAKDYDDAIYFDHKNHTLYVAIADVSSYVDSFGAIDNEAIYRCFTVYFPTHSIPMLPRQLSETLCSLQAHIDRRAFVFKLKLDTKNEIENLELFEALIHSKRRFNYDEVDKIFENTLKPKNEDEKRIFNSLHKLKILTDDLKIKRLKKGFDFRSKDLEIKLDENSEILETSLADETPSHALVEDCMLLANKAAASMFEFGVFRVHEMPSQTKLQNLYNELAGIGIIVEQQETLGETIKFIQKLADEKDLSEDVDTLIIQSQMQARYMPHNRGHFGLGFERYTHFTSPIRRYSDLIVHRILKAKNDKDENAYVLRNIEYLTSKISENEREVDKIENEFKRRKFARWARNNIDQEFVAKVLSTEDLSAEIRDTIIGARVELTSKFDLTLFSDVKIKIISSNILNAKIKAEVVEILDV